jgi:hypothetical protein
LTVALTLLIAAPPVLDARQQGQPRNAILWKKTLTLAAKGTQIHLPKSILNEIRADPNDCASFSPEEAVKVDSYRILKRNVVLIAVWGKSSCFCSPTGNCTFWIYQSRRRKYDLLLETSMVREFGFLSSTTNGLPDLVLWSHDSASRFPGALWKFDGSTYNSECSWEIVSTYRDLSNGGIEETGSHVENNTCKQRLIPETEMAKKN